MCTACAECAPAEDAAPVVDGYGRCSAVVAVAVFPAARSHYFSADLRLFRVHSAEPHHRESVFHAPHGIATSSMCASAHSPPSIICSTSVSLMAGISEVHGECVFTYCKPTAEHLKHKNFLNIQIALVGKLLMVPNWQTVHNYFISINQHLCISTHTLRATAAVSVAQSSKIHAGDMPVE